MGKKLLATITTLLIIVSLTACGGGNKEPEAKEPEKVKYKLNIEVECTKNLLLNKYDVEVSVNDDKLGKITHGEKGSLSTELEAGDYTIYFNEVDGDATGSVGIKIDADSEKKYIITCESDEVIIDEVTLSDTLIGQKKDDVIKQLKDAGFTNIIENPNYDVYFDKEAIGDVEAVSIDGNKEFRSFDDFEKDVKVYVKYHEYYEKNPELAEENTSKKADDTAEKKQEENALNYSTNTNDTVKDGNKGVYAYKMRGESYHQYYIIDFDEGYVYYFTEGNGNESCDKVKIESGTLNDVLIITYQDGGDTWSYGLHFKYKNNPETLIVEDNDHFETKFTATGLKDALAIRDKKDIHEY